MKVKELIASLSMHDLENDVYVSAYTLDANRTIECGRVMWKRDVQSTSQINEYCRDAPKSPTVSTIIVTTMSKPKESK